MSFQQRRCHPERGRMGRQVDAGGTTRRQAGKSRWLRRVPPSKMLGSRRTGAAKGRGCHRPGNVGRAKLLAGLRRRPPPRPRRVCLGTPGARPPPPSRKAGSGGACQPVLLRDGVQAWYKGVAESSAEDLGAGTAAELKEIVLRSPPPSILETWPRPLAGRNPLNGPGRKGGEGGSRVSWRRAGGSAQPIRAPRRAGLQPIAARGSAPGRSRVDGRRDGEAPGRRTRPLPSPGGSRSSGRSRTWSSGT